MTLYLETDPITTVYYREDKGHRTVQFRAERNSRSVRGVVAEEFFADGSLFLAYLEQRFARLTLATQAAS